MAQPAARFLLKGKLRRRPDAGDGHQAGKSRPFTQQDPIGIAGGANVYGFASGDPVNYADPFGLKSCPPFCPELAAAGGAAVQAAPWLVGVPLAQATELAGAILSGPVGIVIGVAVVSAVVAPSSVESTGTPNLRAQSDATAVSMGRLSRTVGIALVGGLTGVFTPGLDPSDPTQTGANAPGNTGSAPPATEKKTVGKQKPKEEPEHP